MSETFFSGLGQNQPVVEVHPNPDTPRAAEDRQFSRKAGKGPGSERKAEGKNVELEDSVSPHEAKKLPVTWMDEHMEIRVLQVQRRGKISRPDSLSYRPRGFHSEGNGFQEEIQDR